MYQFCLAHPGEALVIGRVCITSFWCYPFLYKAVGHVIVAAKLSAELIEDNNVAISAVVSEVNNDVGVLSNSLIASGQRSEVASAALAVVQGVVNGNSVAIAGLDNAIVENDAAKLVADAQRVEVNVRVGDHNDVLVEVADDLGENAANIVLLQGEINNLTARLNNLGVHVEKLTEIANRLSATILHLTSRCSLSIPEEHKTRAQENGIIITALKVRIKAWFGS